MCLRPLRGLDISHLSDVWEGGLAILPLLLLRCVRRGRPPPSSPLLRREGGLPAVRSLPLLRRLNLGAAPGVREGAWVWLLIRLGRSAVEGREGGLAISPLSDVWKGGLAILPLADVRECGSISPLARESGLWMDALPPSESGLRTMPASRTLRTVEPDLGAAPGVREGAWVWLLLVRLEWSAAEVWECGLAISPPAEVRDARPPSESGLRADPASRRPRTTPLVELWKCGLAISPLLLLRCERRILLALSSTPLRRERGLLPAVLPRALPWSWDLKTRVARARARVARCARVGSRRIVRGEHDSSFGRVNTQRDEAAARAGGGVAQHMQHAQRPPAAGFARTHAGFCWRN